MISAAIFVAFVILAVVAVIAEDSFGVSTTFAVLAMAAFFVWAWRIDRPTPEMVRASAARATIAAATATAIAGTAESELRALERAASVAATAAASEGVDNVLP